MVDVFIFKVYNIPMKQYKTHKEVPKKYKWDLSFLLENKTLEENIDELFVDLQQVLKTKDSKYKSANDFLTYLKLEDQISIKVTKINSYFNNSLALNITNAAIIDIKEKFDFQMNEFNQQLGSEEFKFFKHADQIAKWAKLPSFKEYKYTLEYKLEEKDHQLSEEVEEFRIKSARADIDSSDYFETLCYSEVDLGYAITSKGKKIKVTEANRMKLAKHSDKKVRRTASISYKSAYLKHKNSLTSALYQHKKAEATWAKILKFNSSVEYFIFDDRVSKEFLLTLYKATQDNKVINKNFHKHYAKFYQKRFGEKISKYDWARELTNVKTNYSVDEGIALVIEALKPFGSEYTSVVRKAIKDNWIDFMPINNKDTGAYSAGEYGIDKKLILMNWQDDILSVETLAHELGHSMHSYYAEQAQSLRNSNYTIFVAEIASIFNELMLHDYLLNSSKDDKFKFEILTQKIKGFNGTVFRQILFSNYEYDLYTALDQGKPIGSYETLAKMYYENRKKYQNDVAKKFKADSEIEAITVPHYYYGFYVYKYAIGQLVANIFFNRYKNEGAGALKDFINFLKSGGSKDNLDLLKDAGIDLLNPDIYDEGFNTHKQNINEWITLGKKIWKVK